MSKLKIEPMKQPDRLMNYWKKEKRIVVYIILFGLSFNISIVFGPVFQGKLIDSIASGKSLASILTVAVTYVLLIGIIQLLRYFKRFYIRRFANCTSGTMRLIIYNNMMHKDARALSQENIGNLMTRAISDVDLCVEGMRKFTTEVFDTGVLMISYLVTMFVYDVKITLLSVIFVPIAMAIAEKLKSIIYEYSKEFRKKSSEVTDLTYDAIDHLMLYRVNGLEEKNRKQYEKELEDLQKKAVKANLLENSMQPIYHVIAMLGIMIVLYLGGMKVISGNWTIGNYSTYVALFTAMAIKASKAAKLFNSVQKSQVSWKRIQPYLQEYKIKDQNIHLQNEDISLVVNNLSFSYKDHSPNVIEQIHFSGKRGEIIGVTGPIASGKSTLGISLLGMYPYLGSIQINGRELKEYSEYERSQMISYMGHQPGLLSDSIDQNITLGGTTESDSVLKDVCFLTDLENMPNGKNTLVGNGGVKLSGGQQARIALARALYGKKKIIILDDPFSAVDMKTEDQIIENLKSNYQDSIIILISHRLHIFNKIDRILLLKNDQTFEYGTHEELMSQSELYSKIYNLQFTKKEGGR